MYKLVLTLSLLLSCIPPGGAELERTYQREVETCSKLRPKAACECRVALEEKYGLCDHPEWPRIGRCEYRCE